MTSLRSGDERRVDDLRQQLRSLGYLDAGMDRFLLAPATEARGPGALAVHASARVGLLAGVLLGPAAAIGLGARLPGLISGPRDAAVLAGYLGALFFIGFGVLSLTISLGATLLVRARDHRFAGRARRVSSLAASILTIACLSYLTLWWRTANAGFGWRAPLVTALALALAVIISLLLGHAVRITALAVMGAAAGPSTMLPPVASRSWRLMIVGGVVGFAGAAALLVWTAPADASDAGMRPPLTVVSTAKRVRLIAIDGFDRGVYRGVAGHGTALGTALSNPHEVLNPQDTSDPARAWTTIATGEPPEVHGVHGIETRRVAGVQGTVAAADGTLGRLVRAGTDLLRLTRPSIASRDERRAKTMWEVAAEAGLRTAVVNWWATWPAPANDGIVVTDRAALRLERSGPLDAEIAPAELYAALQKSWPALRQRAREAASRSFATVADGELATVLRRSAELDATIIGLLQALPAPVRDLDVVYLPGLDIAQHTLLGGSDEGALPPSVIAARVEAVRSYYRFLEEALAPIVVAREGEIVMIVTQPGRVQGTVGGLFAIDEPGFFVDGEGRANVVDVMPTVLHALGVPLSRELAGQPLTPLLDPVEPRHPVRYVSTYGRPSATSSARHGQSLDQEMIDRLRSLGYVR